MKARVAKALQKSYSEKSGSKKGSVQAGAGGGKPKKPVAKWLPCLVCGRSPKDVMFLAARAGGQLRLVEGDISGQGLQPISRVVIGRLGV